MQSSASAQNIGTKAPGSHACLPSRLVMESPCSRANDDYQVDTQPKLSGTHHPSLSVSTWPHGGAILSLDLQLPPDKVLPASAQRAAL